MHTQTCLLSIVLSLSVNFKLGVRQSLQMAQALLGNVYGSSSKDVVEPPTYPWQSCWKPYTLQLSRYCISDLASDVLTIRITLSANNIPIVCPCWGPLCP